MPVERRSPRRLSAVAAVVLLSCGGLLASCSKKSVDAEEVRPVTVQGTTLAPFQSADGDPAVGARPPTLVGSDFDGDAITIDPAKGPLMLVFLAHWCPHCNAEVPRLLEWKASGAVPPELQVIGIATAANPNRDHYPPSEWIEEIGWDWPVMADSAASEAAEAYGLSAFPYFVIVGADGTVKLRFSGETDAGGLTAAVDRALAS